MPNHKRIGFLAFTENDFVSQEARQLSDKLKLGTMKVSKEYADKLIAEKKEIEDYYRRTINKQLYPHK